MDEFTTHKGVQLTSSVRNAVWIDLSNNHTSTREFLEEQIKEACVNKNDTSPVMVKGAFGIGKTATLHYLFHYAWTKLKVPAFYVNLEQIIEELKIYVNRKKKYSDFGKMKCSKFGNKSAVFSGTILQ